MSSDLLMFDRAMLETFPLEAVGRMAGLQPAAKAGTRFLVAGNGLWREIVLPWIRVLHPLALSALPLPYGDLGADVEVLCGPVPTDLVREFNRHARDHAPTEVAAAIIWNARSHVWRLDHRRARSASNDRIEYDEVKLGDDEHIVIDVHSHGHFPAFFSAEDDRDDYGSMKFSLVVGSFNQERPTAEMRLCMAGVNLPAHLIEGGLLQIKE